MSPLLEEVGGSVSCVDSDVQYKLYMQFRAVFKEFNDNADECTKISKESMQGTVNDAKMKEITANILKVAGKLKSI